jgi:hypothetical protein
MNEDPIISRGVLKAALVLLVAAGIGGGAYALASGDIDLPDVDLETSGEVTSLEDTTLEDTTIGGDEAQRLNRCIERAGSSADEIIACLEKFQ